MSRIISTVATVTSAYRGRRGLALGACAGAVSTALLIAGLVVPARTAQGQAAAIREYVITAVEFKGSTTADKLAPPDENPKDLSKGYGFSPPGYDSSSPLKWEVSSYMWSPSVLLAYRGEQVKLQAFVINGDEHKLWVEGPDGEEVVSEAILNRGREYELSFPVAKTGVYRLVCQNHEPTMIGYVLSLPR